jgi:hypothetical protein
MKIDGGWRALLKDRRCFQARDRYPITAYSEFMPPPRLGIKPYGGLDPSVFDPTDPYGWRVDETEDYLELRPGLAQIARHLLGNLAKLAAGAHPQGMAASTLHNSPCWTPELAERAGELEHERYVSFVPLALSRTQDDKGRVRWTLFGGSEQGPEKAFWKSFYLDPHTELPPTVAISFVKRLLLDAYGESAANPYDAGFRILSGANYPSVPTWRPGRLPAWTTPFMLKRGESLAPVRYLLSFRPFGRLPAPIRRAYLDGRLHLWPCPGSLLFWGESQLLTLQRELKFAFQLALLSLFERSEKLRGIRIPQSGWMHERGDDTKPKGKQQGPVREKYHRTNRWARVHRDADELAVAADEDRLARVLFSTAPEQIGLYGKPMARNAQIWTRNYRLCLDGPRADRSDLERAATALRNGGQFGYRMLFPAMQVGNHEVYWHRPLVAFRDPASHQVNVLEDAPSGYLTAYDTNSRDLRQHVELWPRVQQRPLHRAGMRLAQARRTAFGHRTAYNITNLLDAWELRGRRPLPADFARSIVAAPKELKLTDWLAQLEILGGAPIGGPLLVEELIQRIQPASEGAAAGESALTFSSTARRSFETAYWRTIRALAHGRFVNKENADRVLDAATRTERRGRDRDLEALGAHLMGYYRRVTGGGAVVGDAPFSWHTDFDYPWSGGWAANRTSPQHERNIVVVIPGKNRREAVIMADHYDTAYMEDVYDKKRGGSGARLAAAGADDNHSATAALMLAAPIFMQLSREGRLGCDIWLVHLTGEEFPSDCMGARNLAQRLVEGNLQLRVPGRRRVDLSRTRVRGAYILDMIAHNNHRNRDVFQFAPGTGAQSLWLAERGVEVNTAWNRSVVEWNRRGDRRHAPRSVRCADPHGRHVPAIAPHLALHGEVRPSYDPRSALFNTDGQIFSDAGIPVVLFMENYDINRVGYHDTQDTMANIDLDYGAAVASIAIETVAQAAQAKHV